MAVERHERGLQAQRQLEWVQLAACATALFRHVFADVLPQVAEHRHFFTGYVLRHRHAGQFDNAAFDGIHQREVAHGPGKQGAFCVAGTAQKEWCGRQVHDASDTQFAVDGFKARNPQTGGLVVFIGLFFLITLEVFVIVRRRLFAVAVVGLVVDGHDVFQAHQVGHDALEHLALGFLGQRGITRAALQQLATTLGQLDALPHLEGVVIGDDDLGSAHVVQHVAGQQLAVFVIAVGVVGLQDAQAVFDGEARCANQKATCEIFAGGPAHRVDGLPGDQHGHDGGFARAGGKLQGQAHQLRVGILVGAGKVVQQ